ncbi:outer membrane protein assembly factor BamC, partial [Methylophilaceae bacterium]|nr:outer membrane protein assembly factor BamC [Methylophilaceae bacterium]
MLKWIRLFIALSMLTACSSISDFDIIEDITAPDYVSSSRARKLEIPPDLSQIETQSEYEVPGEGNSYKNYQNKQNISKKIEVKVVQDPDGLKIIKSGGMRWLLVKKDPDTVWPHVQDFWEDMGFKVQVANKRTGVIETEWISTSELKTSASAASRLDKWFDAMSGFADKRKFRTRLEMGSQKGTTEIFLSHRSIGSATDQHKRIKGDRGVDFEIEEVYSIREYIPDGEEKNEKVEITD